MCQWVFSGSDGLTAISCLSKVGLYDWIMCQFVWWMAHQYLFSSSSQSWDIWYIWMEIIVLLYGNYWISKTFKGFFPYIYSNVGNTDREMPFRKKKTKRKKRKERLAALIELITLCKILQGGVCLAFADEVLCWLYGTVKESWVLHSILCFFPLFLTFDFWKWI